MYLNKIIYGSSEIWNATEDVSGFWISVLWQEAPKTLAMALIFIVLKTQVN